MNILRNIILFGWMAIACTAFAQDRNADKVERPNTKKINFGIKAGFNSSMFMVSELKIKDVTIDEVQNNYKIGYFGAIFMRFNIKKHFIQPEASYNVSKGEITFDKLGSQHPAIEPDYASVQSVLHSIDFPVLYGYNVVKKGIPWPLGDFDNRRSFTSIDNLCYVIEGLLNQDVPTGIYHMGDDEALSTNELIGIMCEVMGKKPHIWKMNKRVMEGCAGLGTLMHLPLNTERLRKLTENYVVSNAKIKAALGIDKLPVTAKEGLMKTIRSFEETK